MLTVVRSPIGLVVLLIGGFGIFFMFAVLDQRARYG
jgi:hypothetical protein